MVNHLKNPEDTWYFAYGSNLDVRQKEHRTGTIRHAEPCRLPEYRFAFNKRGLDGYCRANIVADSASTVWGVAYLCDPTALHEMDKSEGVAGGHYERAPIIVFTNSAERLEAITYVAGSKYICAEGAPSAEYLQRILGGARRSGLPEEYIGSIESLARRLSARRR